MLYHFLFTIHKLYLLNDMHDFNLSFETGSNFHLASIFPRTHQPSIAKNSMLMLVCGGLKLVSIHKRLDVVADYRNDIHQIACLGLYVFII